MKRFLIILLTFLLFLMPSRSTYASADNQEPEQTEPPISISYADSVRKYAIIEVSYPGDRSCLSLWYNQTEPSKEPEDSLWQVYASLISSNDFSKLYINAADLEQNKDYYFRLYNENTQQFSNTVCLDYKTIRQLAFDRKPGADSDGDDDYDEDITPDVTQPAPQPPTTTAATMAQIGKSDSPLPEQTTKPIATTTAKSRKETPFTESFLGDTLTISGARLSWMISNHPNVVPFGWNNISVEIPTTFLSELGLLENDTLSLTLAQKENLSFTFSLKVNEKEILDIPQVLVHFLAEEPSEHYILYLSDKPLDTEVTYENGYIICYIASAGTYRLVETVSTSSTTLSKEKEVTTKVSATEHPQPDFFDFLPMILVGFILLMGAGYFIRRKRK